MTSVVDLIATKRDGGELSDQQIADLIRRYVAHEVPDYQMSAMLMAIVWQGLNDAETLALTNAMVASGETIDLSAIGRRIVDKHSTGGVGDKVSLVLAPIVAACGVPFAKMSGRALGHTGGTLDKLESIPGFRVALSDSQFLQQVRDIGIAIIGQTSDIVPADKRLYGLRDVTATVESIPLIAASIMSKKLAAGADAIVLDVKVGSGAFVRDVVEGRELARRMIAIGAGAGRDVTVLLSSMDAPLGHAVGNALELIEVQQILHGGGPKRLTDFVLDVAAELLALSDLNVDVAAGRELARTAIDDGSAYATYERWITAQGGNPRIDLRSTLAPAPIKITATEGGVVQRIEARAIGVACVHLGAGRVVAGAEIDHGVGVQLYVEEGDSVSVGDVLAEIYARDADGRDAATQEIAAAFTLASTDIAGQTPTPSLLLERLSSRVELV